MVSAVADRERMAVLAVLLAVIALAPTIDDLRRLAASGAIDRRRPGLRPISARSGPSANLKRR